MNHASDFEEDGSTVMMASFSAGSFFAERYYIKTLLGSGAMGRVYAATELHSNREVALKVLHKERLGEEETVARFKREAEVLATIGHPCIVKIYTFHHTSDGIPYLAMELLEGVTLKTRLSNAGRFEDPKDFQPIMDGISGALDAAHGRGIVHRDMKPDNVFLPATGDPRAKLVDFGLSRIAKPDKSITHSGMILGTPRYMAPEQIRDASSAGPAGDLYALAVIVFEALAGDSPYPAQDYGQLLGCVLSARTRDLGELRPDLPAAVSGVLKRALSAEPEQRYESCALFAKAFGEALGSPSRVDEISGQARTTEDPRPRLPSLGGIPMNKGSTLAFDVSAMGAPAIDLSSLPADYGASQEQSQDAWDADTTARDGEAKAAPPAAIAPTTPAPIASAPASAPGNLPTPNPAPHAVGPPYGKSQGGDTLFLGNADEFNSLAAPSPMPAHSPPSYAGAAPPGARAPHTGYGNVAAQLSTPVATVPPKKNRGGVIVFIVMLFVVIGLSAAAGLALQKHMSGDLPLPFEIPGVSPESEEPDSPEASDS